MSGKLITHPKRVQPRGALSLFCCLLLFACSLRPFQFSNPMKSISQFNWFHGAEWKEKTSWLSWLVSFVGWLPWRSSALNPPTNSTSLSSTNSPIVAAALHCSIRFTHFSIRLGPHALQQTKINHFFPLGREEMNWFGVVVWAGQRNQTAQELLQLIPFISLISSIIEVLSLFDSFNYCYNIFSFPSTQFH